MLSISQELIVSRRNGRERLNRVEALAAEVGEQTAASGREALARELDALRTDWQQWEESTLQAQSGLETMLSQTTSSEQEFQAQVAQLDKDLTEFKASLTACSHSLSQLQDKTTDEELVECWQKAKETEEALKEAESMSESLKGQLNDLCRFSKDLSSHSDKVSSLIKEYNSLCLQTAKYCQNKERALEQRFRTTFREFQQWMINTKITTCFDTPQNIDEATAIIQKLQDFLSESEACQSKLNTLISKGELLGRILSKDKAEAIQTKVSTAKEDWKNLLTSLHRKEAALQNLQSQMKDFEAGVGPVQEWLIATEAAVQGSNSQLPDLVAKKNEQFRLQSVLEDITYREPQLNKLKEKAQHLWEDQASNKSFMHRVSQLSAWYLALSNLAKEKTLRAQRTVSEHQQFSQGLKELQDWLADARHMLESYCAPTADKNLLDSRMAKVEALLALRQEKEIQLKMVLTRGESVLRSTSPEGTVAIRQQMAGLKDSWDSLLSFSIQCKSQLEGALSQWTSYQDDVRQFMSWMDRMEGDLKASERQCTELRDKATALGKAKLLYEDTRSHSRLLETIQAKGESMAQHYVSRLELQELQERFSNLSEKAKEGTRKAEEQLLLHQEYQLGLKSFEEWLEQEKENLCCCSHLGNDVETLESTLRDLEDLEKHCTEGQTLMSAVLQSQEKMTLSGSTYMEDRILESAQRDWHLYQRRLAETKEKVNATLSMLRKLEKMFQQVDVWLSDLEGKVNIRTGRKSDRDTKQTQLQQLQKWNEEILARKDEVERVGLLAHQVLEESHINSSVGSQATHLAARYQGILLHVVDQTKLLKEELRALEEADLALGTYTDWLRATQKNFKNMAVALNVVDKTAMENKIKKFETLHNDIDMGNSLLKMILEKSERAIEYLEGPEAQGLRESMDGHIGQLNELTSSIRRERGNLEKCLYLTKEFLDKYQSQTKWLAEYQAILQIPVEPKVELFEKKAQLAKYKAIQQTIVSHEPGIKLVIEKGQAVFELIHDPAVSDNLKRLQTDYQELRSTVMVCVQNLGEKVREHEDYNSNLQEVEKWLLQISTRLVAPDTTQSTNLEMATQHLARHKPIMEEIAGFEHALASLRSKGDSLVANCSEGLQGKFKHQVQGHLQGIRDSYSAICSTAQRLYQSLERELQKHVSHQDTLQQCQAWLHSVQQELKPRDHPPTSPRKSLKQVKHYRALQEQASTYLELLCSMCDLSDDTVKIAAADIQHTKQAIEQRLVRSQELALGWEEVKRQKAELGACFLETEQQLHSLKRRPAELELKIAQKQVAQVQELGRHFQSRQANITALTEKVSALTEGQESPEHSEIGQLSNQWLELCHQINALLSLSEEDQQRARDYHDRVSVVEVLLDKFTKEWDNLARTDAESTAEHLEALRKLAGEVQAQRFVLDDLKEQKQMLMDRLDPEDKELIKEQSSHLERQWVQLEGLIEKKIQLSARVLEELSQCQARLDDLLEWAEAQAQLFGEALRCSPPAELAQTLLPDHIAVCNELESQELAHGALTEEAERILAQLGLDERQQLQRALSALHGRMGSLHEAVGQRRKYLSQALSDRTQFLMAVGLASSWVQQNRLVATSKEPAALMPAEVGKQIRSCKSVGSRLKEYQTDVAALWAQGRELAKEATEEETSEIMAQLQELQATYDSALQEGAQRLQELEKVLLSRKYFKADLDRVCQWMKQADVVTFPQVSLMGGDAELSSQLARYRQVLEQSAEHENLLLLVQRAGRELLPSLSEADHSFLDEKLNALPRQFNSIVGLAKEKSEKIQEAMAARQEYASLVSLTGKALGELEEQLVRVSKARLSLSSEEAQSACSDCRALLDEVTGLGKAVDDLNQRKETFRSSGQPWMPDEVAGLSGLHSRLRRQAERQLALLGDTAEAYREHEACSLRLEARLRALAEELVRVNEETLSVEERLKNYHALAGTVQEVSSLLKGLIEQVEQFSPELDTGAREARSQQLQAWKEELQSAQGTISARIMECESRLVQTIDFQTEIQHSLDWLQQVKGDLSADLNLDVNLQGVQEEIRKSQILEEEVQSSLRIMVALSSKEKEKYSESRDLMPPEVESNLLELSRLEAEVQETLSSKKTSLDKAQTLVQQYLRAVQSARGWLDDASALLQQTGDGVDVEASEETLRRHVEFFATEAELASRLGELEALMPGFLPLINTAGREHVEQNLASLRQRRADTEQQAEAQQAVLQRCVTQWQDYQEARQQVIALMNQAEKRLSEFSSAKAATSHESEEKLTQHKSLLSVVNSFHEKITALEEQASHLESLGNDASKATISRSMTTVWQRWTRLRTVAREQEKMLEEAARGWKNLTDKIETTTVVVDQLQDRLPDSSVEKARKTELLELLEYHDAFAQEVEREQSTLTVLRQQALNMLRDVALPSTSVEDLPVMHEIKAMQDRYDNVRQKIRKSKKMVQQELKEREEVESELNAVKQWLHETREYLLNPTSDAVTELRELKELHTEVAARHQTVAQLGDRQRDKYLELYTILPSELSEQLAEVTLALGAIEEQVNLKEGEAQQMQAVTLDFNCRMQQISDELNDISKKLKEKGTDIVQAKIEHKRLWDKVDSCNVKLVELDATIQDFTEQNPHQSKCLTDDMIKLSSLYQQVFKETEYRASKLNKAASQLEEFHEMLEFVLKWLEKAKDLGYSAISWHCAAQLNDQLITYQATLRESEEIQSDLQAMGEKLDSVSDVHQTGAMSQRVANLHQQTDELQQLMRTRLQSLQDAAKDMEQFETEVKSLQVMVKQAQVTLTSPELARLCLKEQLFQRQRLLADMESFKHKVQVVHRYQAALRIPEEIVTNLPICLTALRLQEQASRLQHTAIQQCNILQEAVIQYEQCEQEMRHLQQLIDRAHREIQEKPVSTSNIQQLQAQISRHEQAFAQKIKDYQEQIAALNTKCKMLTMKAKHATMLLTVTEVEGLSEGMEELDGESMAAHSAHPSVVMMTAGRCHTLLSPVTEESGEEGTNSELSSPTACRSPSPNADVSGNQDSAYYGADELQTAAPDSQDTSNAASLQEPLETTLGESASSKLDDLQRSWETLKNVISEKQRTLYEALERQQKYQDSVQSVSAKMESIEGKLGEALDASQSHDVQVAAHQALMEEIVTLQDEINELQICFAEELVSDTMDTDTSDQLAMQSTLTVLAERMATIKMKALGKKQLLEERLNEQEEQQRQEQALQVYRSEADELDNWLLITKAILDATLKVPKEQMDMDEQLNDCQNMLVEIERKVASVSELSMNSENLVLEGKPQTREQAEHLIEKLQNLKGSLVELQKMLQDRSISIKHGVVQEKEDTEIDFTFRPSPSVQEWLVQARASRYQHQQNSLQRQKELEQQLAEQKNLLRSVASSGEKIMTQQSNVEAGSEEQRAQATETAQPETLPLELGFEGEKLYGLQQLGVKWRNLLKEISSKQKLFEAALEQNQEQKQVYGVSSTVSSGMVLFKGEAQTLDKSVQTAKSLLTGLGQAFGEVTPQGKDAEEQSLPLEQKLYDAVSVTCRWLDGIEDHLLVSTSFLPEKAETHLYHEEALGKDIEEVIEEVNEKKDAFFHILPEPVNQDAIEETVSCLCERLGALGLTVKERCEKIKDQLQQLVEYQTELKLLITSLADSKYVVLQKLAEALGHTVTEQLQAILQAEDDLREFEARIGHLKERGEKLQPDQAILLDLSKVQDMYEELTMIIGSSRSSLNQSLALRGQYEQALQDLTDLTDTGQEKMSLDKRILVTSKEDVKNLLNKHKEFFQGLESHKILTETLCKKVNSCIHQKESSSQQELMTKCSALLKAAHGRGVELESVFETWTNLARDYEALYRQLEGVENSIPGAGLVEESEERLTERIALYQRLKASLTEHQPQLYQVLEDGRKLLMSVSCAELEAQVAQLGENWLSSTTRVSRELHRLETVLKHWNRYQVEYTELNQWLQSAVERLEFWKLQSVTLPQELDAIRDHLSSFLEFSKEVDTKSSLKSSVLSRGNQLLRLKKVDTASLRSGLAQTDGQWTELLTQIPLVQERLHQLQMEKLPSRTAINELMNWISLMEQTLEEDDERIRSAVGSQMIEQYLKKYKAFKIDLACKQLTVDFVNQSVLQISSHDVESKRSDKTDFAERLGIMNRRWQLLQGHITEQIGSLETSRESWAEYENSVQCLKDWFESQEDQLKKWHSISDLASIHSALKDCQELEDIIRVKEKEVEKVEKSGLVLIQNKKEEASSNVMETLRELNHSWAHLDHLVGQLKITLQSLLDQWNIYKAAYEDINGHLMDARYSLSRFRLLTGCLEAVKIQVDNLQNLQEELDKSEGSLQKFDSVSNQLLKECHPPDNSLLTTNLNEVNTSWNNLLQDIAEQLHSSKILLQLWQKYRDYSGQCSVTVRQQEDKSNELIKKAANRDIAEEEVTNWIQDCDALLEESAKLRDSLHVLSDLGEEMRQQVDSSAAAAIQSDQLSLSQRLSTLEHALSRQRCVLQAGVRDYETFSKRLEALEEWIVEADEVLKSQDPNRSSDLTIIQDRMEELKVQMLRFSSTVPDLDRLNELGYRLPLNDKEIKRMQTLNRHWSSISAQTTERFSKLQAFLLQHQTFLEKCETWMEFLVQTEQTLAVEISGNYQNLLEQQRAHELFQTEMFSRQQILHSIISDGQRLLEQGQVDDRDEFNSKLAMLSNQWQGVIRRAQQRRGIIDSQVRQWQRYRELAEKLRKWLSDVSQQLEQRWGSAAPIALQQARSLLDEVQLKEKVLQRQQGSYILTVEAGKQLLLSADAEAEATLQAELTDIQEQWQAANIHLEEQRKQLNLLLKDWERCEKGIADSLAKLRSFKRKLSQPLPDHHDELHTEQIRCMELESSFGGWTDDLAHLSFLKETLSSYIRADDISLLQERIELLHRQWDELCHQVSLRRQLVTEKLNEWVLFNEKNKELCEWLTLMESKVSQNGDISIEEMIEKLKKDYQEEITAASENKMQLQQMGQRLMRASHESKASEIEYKLGKADDRWQHLLDLIGARVKKLKETLVAVQQLDKNMSSLRSWLAQIETELSKPIVYDSCDSQEIQHKLAEQQELQRDIEKHSTGVASVLNLCEVLLHDCDACATETECDSIQQATRNLDRRWRNICAMSMERRLKIEETWRLWQKFLDDYSRFEDWLETSERTAAMPNSSGVLYTVAKEELKKFEAFQRQVHESLTQLELINKQYRRLARENRTDSGSKLKDMVHEGNQRWDNLQRRVTAILRRLKHFIGQREEFETTRESILVWLTEMDLQLTNIEHFSECDVQAKIKQLKAFQQEIALNTSRIDQLFVDGEQLIEKSEPMDAAIIEEELEELHRYYQEVFGRVDRYYKKLMQLPLTDDEHEVSDRETEIDENSEFSSMQWLDRAADNVGTPPLSLSRGTGLPQPKDTRSGRDTPASVDSIPLEWDHDYDLSRNLESAVSRALEGAEDGTGDEDSDFYLKGAAEITDVVIPESPEAYLKLTESALRSTGEPGHLEKQIRQLDKALDSSRYHLQQTENAIRSKTPTGPELDSSYWGYMKLLSECRGSIETVKRVGHKLKEEEDKLSGLINLTSTESQTSGVIERWELIQAQALNKELRMKQNLQQWQQFNSDLDSIWQWLSETEEELEHLSKLDISTDIQTIELRIKKLKELQKAVDNHKAIILSINLCSAEFTQSDTSDVLELRERLSQMNKRWDQVGSMLEAWRHTLQDALMQCHDFHEMSHGLLLWLENIDRRRNEILPLDPNLDSDTLQDHHKTLLQIRRELLESQLKVASLQDMSSQLLVNAEGSDCLEAKEKVHVIGNRLKLLLKEVTQDLKELERILDNCGSQADLASWSSADDLDSSGSLSPVSGGSLAVRPRLPRGICSLTQPGASVSSPHSRLHKESQRDSSHSKELEARKKPSFLLRVLRAALPLQLLLLLLIALACLVPMTEEDYSCASSNNFARSFHPMLRYTNGPPPI